MKNLPKTDSGSLFAPDIKPPLAPIKVPPIKAGMTCLDKAHIVSMHNLNYKLFGIKPPKGIREMMKPPRLDGKVDWTKPNHTRLFGNPRFAYWVGVGIGIALGIMFCHAWVVLYG